MRVVADLARRYSFDELRVSHHQNLVLPHVKRDDVFTVWKVLEANGLAGRCNGTSVEGRWESATSVGISLSTRVPLPSQQECANDMQRGMRLGEYTLQVNVRQWII